TGLLPPVTGETRTEAQRPARRDRRREPRARRDPPTSGDPARSWSCLRPLPSRRPKRSCCGDRFAPTQCARHLVDVHVVVFGHVLAESSPTRRGKAGGPGGDWPPALHLLRGSVAVFLGGGGLVETRKSFYRATCRQRSRHRLHVGGFR